MCEKYSPVTLRPDDTQAKVNHIAPRRTRKYSWEN